MTRRPPSPALLARYLAGECSADEAARVDEWLAADPDTRRRQLDELTRTWDSAGVGRQEWNADAALGRIKRNAVVRLMRSSPPPAPRVGPPVLPAWVGWTVATAAAAVLICVGLQATWLSVNGPALTAPVRAMREYSAAAGERLTVTLSDSTRVTLAPASRLDVAADYASGQRAVWLTGEALFTVVHNAQHPFVVHTSNGDVRDVGTTFDLRVYTAEPERVAVTEGAIATRGVNVFAGELATVHETWIAVAPEPHIERYVAWASGKLVFHARPLTEVARDLSRWYNLDVRITDPVLGRRLFSGSYTTESPNAVLSLITAATHARYLRIGRIVTITPR
jgi:transmembrane sensor